MRARAPLACSATAAIMVALVAGCATSGDPKPATPQQRADTTPAQAELWAKLGYRLDWRGFPTWATSKCREDWFARSRWCSTPRAW